MKGRKQQDRRVNRKLAGYVSLGGRDVSSMNDMQLLEMDKQIMNSDRPRVKVPFITTDGVLGLVT